MSAASRWPILAALAVAMVVTFALGRLDGAHDLPTAPAPTAVTTATSPAGYVPVPAGAPTATSTTTPRREGSAA